MTAKQRTHDEFYLKEDRSREPKEYFKFLVALAAGRGIADREALRIVDVGCASGDLLYYLRQRFPSADLHGIDVMPALVEAARAKVPDADCRAGNINDAAFAVSAPCDVVIMAGVHSIFDQCDVWVKNIVRLMAPQGTGFVFGLFNPLPYDVLVQVRKSGEQGNYESGWNCVSRETVAAEFARHGCTVEFVKWDIPLDIPQNKEDGLRSWTTPLADGTRLITNASRVIHDFYCAVITRR